MIFLIDQQLPPLLVGHFSHDGHDAWHVRQLGLSNAPDLEIWREAERRSAVIVTKDEDFPRLARERGGVAVVWVRLGNCDNASLMRRLIDQWPSIVQRLADGDRLIEIR